METEKSSHGDGHGLGHGDGLGVRPGASARAFAAIAVGAIAVASVVWVVSSAAADKVGSADIAGVADIDSVSVVHDESLLTYSQRSLPSELSLAPAGGIQSSGLRVFAPAPPGTTSAPEFLKTLSTLAGLDEYPPDIFIPTMPGLSMTPFVDAGVADPADGGTTSGPDANNPFATPLVELAPAQVARRLASAFDQVQTARVVVPADGLTSGSNEYQDPQGYLVSARITLDSLNGEPVLLTWSLSGATVEGSWTTRNVAYRVTPTTESNTGTVQFWVPKMRESGPYLVNVRLENKRGEVIADAGTPLTITVP